MLNTRSGSQYSVPGSTVRVLVSALRRLMPREPDRLAPRQEHSRIVDRWTPVQVAQLSLVPPSSASPFEAARFLSGDAVVLCSEYAAFS